MHAPGRDKERKIQFSYSQEKYETDTAYTDKSEAAKAKNRTGSPRKPPLPKSKALL